MTEVTLTLLDGSVITLNYSSELDLTSGGFQTLLASWHGADRNDGRTVEAHFGTIEDFVEVRSEWLGGRQELVDITQDDPVSASASRRVERRAFEDLAYLLFEFDGWTVSVWDGVPGSPNPVMTADEQRLWASALGGFTDVDGFLVLHAEPGLTLVPAWDEGGPSGPDGRIDGASGGLGIFLNDCDRMTRLDESSYEPPVFAWCDEETNTLFFAFGEDAAVNQRIHETLQVRRLYVPTVGWIKPEAPVFVPPTSLEDGKTVLPLAFPDGSHVSLVFPSAVDLTSHGVVPYSSGYLPGIGRDFNIYYGSAEQTLARFTAEKLGEYPDADGKAVGFYHLDEYGWEVNHLVFEFEGWTVLVYDYTTRFDGGAATMTEEERATWALSFHGTVDRNGFLILSADPPLRLAEAGDHAGPQLSLTGTASGLTLDVARCEPYEEPPEAVEFGTFSWCDQDAAIVVRAHGDGEFIELMREALEIRRPTAAP